MALSLILTVAAGGARRSPAVSALVVMAIAAGIAFQVPNAANLAGYQAEIMRQGVEESFGDVRVRPRRGRYLPGGLTLADVVRGEPDVVATVPIITVPGAVGRGDRTKESMVIGIDAGAAGPHLPPIDGRAPTSGSAAEIVLTRPLAERLGVARGQEISLKLVLGTSLLEEVNVSAAVMTVVGIAEASFVSPEGVIVDRRFLAGEIGAPDAASALLVHLRDHDRAGAWAAGFAARNADVQATAWADDVPFLDSALRGSRAVAALSRLMGFTAVLVPVWALLHVNAIHRRRETALLRALGFRRRAVLLMHLGQVLLLALPGIVLGLGVAVGLCLYFQRDPLFAAGSFVIRPVWAAAVFLWPTVIVLLTAVAAALLPAARAVRVDAAGVLRGNE